MLDTLPGSSSPDIHTDEPSQETKEAREDNTGSQTLTIPLIKPSPIPQGTHTESTQQLPDSSQAWIQQSHTISDRGTAWACQSEQQNLQVQGNYAVERQIEVNPPQVWEGGQQSIYGFQNVVEDSRGEQSPYASSCCDGFSAGELHKIPSL